jgi:nucleolar protein 4
MLMMSKIGAKRVSLRRVGSLRLPPWTQAVGLSKLDLQRRAASKAEKESKLKSPNFFVSDTRLSVHNLPLKTDDKALKKIFMDAVQRRATKEVPVVKQAKVLRYVRAGIRSLS